MSKKTLLLTANYEVLSFLSEKKVFKLIYLNKVEILNSWDDTLLWGKEKIKYPAILKLTHQIKRQYYNSSFSRKSLVRRDHSICQFCSKQLTAAQITIDHIIPKSQGGLTNFINCVVCCQNCNSIKANRTPEQANMVLMRKPAIPSFSFATHIPDIQDHWFSGWNDFLNQNR